MPQTEEKERKIILKLLEKIIGHSVKERYKDYNLSKLQKALDSAKMRKKELIDQIINLDKINGVSYPGQNLNFKSIMELLNIYRIAERKMGKNKNNSNPKKLKTKPFDFQIHRAPPGITKNTLNKANDPTEIAAKVITTDGGYTVFQFGKDTEIQYTEEEKKILYPETDETEPTNTL